MTKEIAFSTIITTKLDYNKFSEAVRRKCSIENVFLKISRNSKENTFAGVFF